MATQYDNVPQAQDIQSDDSTLEFDFHATSENHSIIKVIGVGGGGSNAVQHMYDAGIQDVSFLIINTDKQALRGSSIPNKLLISDKGLGAGARPEIARDYAVQYAESIRNALSDGTEMVFITAGMGGGTGTGAAPIVAQIAQEKGILTVGIVTIPFRFEGRKKIIMALEGVRSIEKHCDALLVVNNNRLIDIYPDFTFDNAFGKADDTLTTAAKSISDIINIKGYINLDFADVSTTLRNGGVALISTGSAHGENRLSKAIQVATTSPLLQDNDINDARRLLFELCFSHNNPLSMSEIDEMNSFVDQLNGDIEVIWGAMYDDSLNDDVRIIILASGFAMDHSSGSVFAGTKLESYVREIRKRLRDAIVAMQEHLAEFYDYPEASEVLSEAIRQATDKANILTPDDNLEEETAKLDLALTRAREKKNEVIEKKKLDEMEEAEALRRKALEDQIAALKAQLAQPAAPVAQPAPAAAQPAPAAAQPGGASPVAPAPAQPYVTPTPQCPPVQPAATPQEGIDRIRQYYGEETASKFMLSDARRAYYVLDDNELSNAELVERLEQVPSYNRNPEDVNRLRALGHQQRPDDNPKH